MDPTSIATRSRFRFGDQRPGDSTDSDASSSGASASSSTDGSPEPKLKSMTAQGIKHLCSELLELKKASDHEFFRSVYSNLSTFIGILEMVKHVENELMDLKQQISTQKKHVHDLLCGICPVIVSESQELSFEDTPETLSNPLSGLETYGNVITETLDVLISEHRLDEALLFLEMEPTNLQKILSNRDFPPDIVMCYNSAISERRRRLRDQFVVEAEHPRVAAPEFQKALSGLCRLGESHWANRLLLQYYSSRLERGILDLVSLKSSLQELYVRELAKHVFSVISHATRSFFTLHGETSPYTSELMRWAREKTEMFVSYFDIYVKSNSETRCGLPLAMEAMQHALSYCSLLEAQKMSIRFYLIKLLHPCMENVLGMHIVHLKKCIGIITTTDAWISEKYLISELFPEMHLHCRIDERQEYYLLTNSGRKFVSIVQSLTGDAMPLISLQMENSILQGLCDLFIAYVEDLQMYIPNKANVVENESQRTNMANTLQKQLALLANASTLEKLFFQGIAENIFKEIRLLECEALTENIENLQEREFNNRILLLKEAMDRLRVYSCHQLVSAVMSLQDEEILTSEVNGDGQSESNLLRDAQPSIEYQVLFLKLRQLEKVGREVFVGRNEVDNLLRESMEAVIFWLSNDQELWKVIGESSADELAIEFEQFLLDMHFLVQIANFGGYLTDNFIDASLDLIDRMETALLAAGLDPNYDIIHDGRATKAANAAIDKLLKIEQTQTQVQHVEGSLGSFGEYVAPQQDKHPDIIVKDVGGRYFDNVGLESGKFANVAEANINSLQDMGKTEMVLIKESTSSHEEVQTDDIAIHFLNSDLDFKDSKAEYSEIGRIPISPKSGETKKQSPKSSPNVLVEDLDNAMSSISGCQDMSDGMAENIANLVIEEIIEP